MRLLLLHKYGHKAASYRYRLEAYLPHLRAAGYECEVSSLLGDDYLEARFKTGKRDLLAAAHAAGGRLKALLAAHRFDLVIIFVDLAPFVPPVFERYLKAVGVPYIFDFDDPVFHYYDRHSSPIVRLLLGEKIRTIIRGAERVFAGSPYLVDYSRTANDQVEYLPTVVDLDVYSGVKLFGAAPSPERPFVVGWLGSPSTASYLPALKPALERFAHGRHVKIRLVGAGPVELGELAVERRDWAEESEIQDLLSFDVGLMPLTDDPWSRGKCGFKLIQYMACGLPVIASPVGVNSDIVTEGENGFLARDTDEWYRALVALYEDPARAARLGAAGRERVRARYSLAVTAPRFLAGVAAAVKKPRSKS